MTSNIFSIKPSKIYVYLRVSTRSQTLKSNGLEDQCKICEDYIEKNFSKKITIKHFTDIGSSYNDKNILVNLNKLIREISKEEKSLILVRDISRLGRNTFQVFNLLRRIKKSNSYIIGIDENLCWNYNRLMDRKFSHAVIDSEEQSDIKSIRQSNRIKAIKKNNGHVGYIPYGTQIIKKNNVPYLYKNPIEIKMLRNIKDVYLKYLNIGKTTEYFNNKNIKNRGKKWKVSQISSILKKYFPNVIKNKNSDMIDNYFANYKDYSQENFDIENISNSIENVKLFELKENI